MIGSEFMAEVMDFSKTQRIVFLIDLHPLLLCKNPNPNPYISAVLAAAKRLLNFSDLSKCLFSFKLFFSSLSPIRSASAVRRLISSPAVLTSFSFHSSSQILTSLSTTLTSFPIPLIATELSKERPSVLHTASSLLQLVHDYAWESELENLKVNKHNLVLLFSPVRGFIDSFFKSIAVDTSNQDLDDLDSHLVKFCDAFASVKNAFDMRSIHLSWIDVISRSEGGQDEMTIKECGTRLAPLMKGIRQLSWGFSSTDSIVLGSALLPFGLIYPLIGVSLNYLSLIGSSKRTSVQLSLGILDVNGNPLECNCCDLELVNMKNFPSEIIDHQSIGSYHSETVSSNSLDDTTKLCIKSVHKYNDWRKMESYSADIILVREFYGDPKKHRRKPRSEFVVDKALDIVSRELNGCSTAQSLPIWQILLSFLYREGYWASVSLSTRNGDTTVHGILKPFTVFSALLEVKDDSLGRYDCKLSNSGMIDTGDCCNVIDRINLNGMIGSQGESSTSGACDPPEDGKKKKSRKSSVRDHTWSSFCKAATDSYEFDLADVYLARDKDNKKLKFLKCWFKQVAKSNQRGQETLTKPRDNSEPSIFPDLISEPSEMHKGSECFSGFETLESFFDALQKRIQHGLATGMDLQSLAERLVKSSIFWCRQASAKRGDDEDQSQPPKQENSWETLFLQLIKLLLKDPKDMKPSDFNSKPEVKVREYELQVLLRMEYLRLDILGSFEEPSKSKHKMEKQICSLLEVVQYLIDGGIHGNVSLFEYVESTIKTRYHDSLQDTVNRIYSQMDLLPFDDDEEETQAVLFNSEDSSHSCRDKKEIPEKAEIHDKHQSFSSEDQSYQQQEHVDESPGELKNEEHKCMLNEARERRERSRRFVSFSSRMPDLQRVWAPKNNFKPTKGKSDSFHKGSKRKDRKSSRFTVVSETPMTGHNRPSSTCSGEEGYAHKEYGNCSKSASKALFLD